MTQKELTADLISTLHKLSKLDGKLWDILIDVKEKDNKSDWNKSTAHDETDAMLLTNMDVQLDSIIESAQALKNITKQYAR